MISQNELKKYLHYDPETGIFTWLERPVHHFKSDQMMRRWNTRYSGKKAGTRYPSGYIGITILKVKYYAHRLAWLYVHGCWPVEVDHDDGSRSNNSISNLKDVSHQSNQKNQQLHSRNKSGVCGVHWNKKSGKWRAGIGSVHIGHFDDFDIAVAARKQAESDHNYNQNHGRSS